MTAYIVAGLIVALTPGAVMLRYLWVTRRERMRQQTSATPTNPTATVNPAASATPVDPATPTNPAHPAANPSDPPGTPGYR